MNTSYSPDSVLKSAAQVRELYGDPSRRSLLKELDHLSEHYRSFVSACPFMVLASVGPEGLDASPRGDDPGFVRVVDAHTLMLPDRRGNNRADTLMNIVRDPRVALLFLIPGVGETLRVIGSAEVVVDSALSASFTVQGKAPRSVVVVHVEKVYYQCQKALVRSRLWQSGERADRAGVPSAGQILEALDKEFDGTSYDRDYSEYMQKTIY